MRVPLELCTTPHGVDPELIAAGDPSRVQLAPEPPVEQELALLQAGHKAEELSLEDFGPQGDDGDIPPIQSGAVCRVECIRGELAAVSRGAQISSVPVAALQRVKLLPATRGPAPQWPVPFAERKQNTDEAATQGEFERKLPHPGAKKCTAPKLAAANEVLRDAALGLESRAGRFDWAARKQIAQQHRSLIAQRATAQGKEKLVLAAQTKLVLAAQTKLVCDMQPASALQEQFLKLHSGKPQALAALTHCGISLRTAVRATDQGDEMRMGMLAGTFCDIDQDRAAAGGAPAAQAEAGTHP
eukprot:TRINITY_DN5561_c0_g2_i2.p1 TRINITY_DN5561_c0_g2~~TRINITY_DN5561_c0_g2_i2.p1  ORF type:complete len:300 (+),score=101.34 TRINITY_DN5561_c0_g2_i2:87-986(+)